jgi:hypothetical protein
MIIAGVQLDASAWTTMWVALQNFYADLRNEWAVER